MLRYQLNKTAHARCAEFELIAPDGSLAGRASYDLWVPAHPGVAVKWSVPIDVELRSGAYAMQPQMLPEDRIRFKQIGFFPWSIVRDGAEAGRLRGVDAGEFRRFSPNDFMASRLLGVEYKCYRVGAGRKGLWQCVYRVGADGTEHEVAQVDCPVRVDDWLDRYGICALDGGALDMACMFALAYNYRKEEHFLQEPVPGRANTQRHLVRTTSRELKCKYNPRFEKQ